MSLSPDLLKRLTYSKYLFRRAKELRGRGDELSSAEAISLTSITMPLLSLAFASSALPPLLPAAPNRR
jgi:hypothetical protein